MGWLRLVGSLKWWVSFAKEPYKRDYILQKRPKILRSLLIVATPYLRRANLLVLPLSIAECIKRKLFIWKENYSYEKRPIHMKRDLFIWKETSSYEKRPIHMKGDLFISKDTASYQKTPNHVKKKPVEEIYLYEKRPIHVKRDHFVSKGTESYQKTPNHMKSFVEWINRDLFKWKETSTNDLLALSPSLEPEKIPIHMKRHQIMWKKTYSHEKRPIHMERDLFMWKETSTHVKRDLYKWPAYSLSLEPEIDQSLGVAILHRRVCQKRPIHMKRDL